MIKNQVQLITYVDRLSGGGITELANLLRGSLQGLFAGVHLLPFYDSIDGVDAGFDPEDHTQVDEKLGTWKDIKALSEDTQLMADLIANHISRSSPQCRDFLARGYQSEWAALFLTRDCVFPQGATDLELAKIYRPRPEQIPFTKVSLANGEEVEFWTTFTPEQIDIDVSHPLGRDYLNGILQTFATNGVRMVRLDAVGYTVKKAGTTCFMLPETYDYISELSAQVGELGMEVLVEVHSYFQQQIEIARQVDWVYDFALPPLVLHALTSGRCAPLKFWLEIRPENALTVLDTHDGIGVIDVGAGEAGQPGLLSPEEIDALVETIHNNSHQSSRHATGAAASNLDLYQVNCTYYDALGRSDLHYLLARAIQFFVPGIPQVYYVGLLAGKNDLDLLAASGVGRDINRHYYTPEEVSAELQRPVVSSLFSLIRFRNSHAAFQGEFSSPPGNDNELILRWHKDAEFTELTITFGENINYQLIASDESGTRSINLQNWGELGQWEESA